MVIQQPNGGRIVEIDDEVQAHELLRQGFTQVSPEVEQRWRAERLAVIKEANQEVVAPRDTLDVYLKTTNRRGDGYGMSSAHLIREGKAAGLFLNETYNQQKIGMIYHRPTGVVGLDTELRVIYTMFESTKIPGNWKMYCDFADKVLVPSKWCQQVFAEAGVETEVVPLGYNSEVFTPVERPQREVFTFLHYDAFNVRKGFLEVFKAFNMAFKPTDPVRLVFKTTRETLPFPIPKGEYPNIDIIQGDVTEKELADMLETADCFVFPSRGEGFGIPPLEAMATGLPVIVPNAHGISEYFNPECMVEVKVKGECPAMYHSFKGQDVGTMVMTDTKDLAKQMRYLFKHQDEARAIGAKAAEYAKEWSYKESAKKLSTILRELAANPPKKKRDGDILAVDTL